MISLKKAESAEEIRNILRDPELFGRIAEDGHDPEEYKIPFDGNQCYMLIMLGDNPIGVWNLYPVNSTTLNIHCNIIKEYREYGKEAGRLILEWFVNHSPNQYQKLNAEIPVIYPSVYHYTKGMGLQDEGLNRLSIMKNGELVDQYRLGTTRTETIKFLEGK